MNLGRYRNLFFYISTIGIFSALMIWIVKSGKKLEIAKNVLQQTNVKNHWNLFTDSFAHNLVHPLSILLLQIITIIIVARILSWLCKKINQPTVIGEIVAGIVLGPSLMGMYFPQISEALFPEYSLNNLQFLSQIGLILFMFVIGMELDLKVLRNKAHEAVVVSHASIIIPFTLGMALAFFMYRSFAPEGVNFLSFSLFLGISMSITAFPVLARMVQERGIHKSSLGALVITCAAIDDITAWSALAAVIAIVKAGSFMSSLPTVAMALGYVFIMIKVVKPFLKRIGNLHASRENLSKPVVAIFFLVLLLSSYATEIIGIHALFGAFMAGTIMPDNHKFKQLFIEKVEDVALVLLLPLFFVYTGLRTQIGLLNDPYLWGMCILVILVAVTGKFAGSALAAKFVGQSWKNSLTIGALMNTRGLVELVALNIGYELGILTPEIFTMLVIMALVTTFMTSPTIDLIDRAFRKKDHLIYELEQFEKNKILISFGHPEMGRTLLRLVHGFSKKSNGTTSITALHLSPGNLFNKFKIDDYEQESFSPIISESQILNKKINTIFRISEDIDSDIAQEANNGNYDLLLVGMGQSIYEGSALGKILRYTSNIIDPDRLIARFRKRKESYDQLPFDERTREILTRINIPVGVFINKGLKKISRIILPVCKSDDAFLIEYARKFINNSEVQVTIWDIDGKIKNHTEIKESVRAIEQVAPNYITLTEKVNPINDLHQHYDLMLVSPDGWKKMETEKNNMSVLIIRP